MIPYFELRRIPLGGGASVAAFGVLVMAGVVAGIGYAQARARALGLPKEDVNTAIAWALIAGFLGSHLAVLLLDRAADHGWWGAFEFWNGMSSFGGFFGALAGLAIHFRRRKAWLLEADILIQGLVLGWVFGRLGCALVHDHVGRPSDFVLAMRFPDGPRHDLGLYELLYTVGVLVPAVFVLNRRPRPSGETVWVISLLYAPARFFGDFLRNTDLPSADARYLGLTTAQYGCVALALVGLAFAWRLHGRPPGPPRAEPAP
ncbi:MAG: phosphatidylglycerol---prolipoprotein diacylglyceryl transferase [Candidatus Binatota bacterium]|nr:phosphatidylglycerol---prolipoprotein diacylglyceryl transferase [Candidatus Binatota bacterium]